MKIISWNINGLRAVVKNGFYDFLKLEKPDIVALQEIKIDDETRAKHQFDFPSYEEYFYGANKKGYSGTGILSKEKIIVKNGFGFADFDSEGRVQTTELKDFYFVNVYFPNSRHDLSRLKYKEDFNKAILSYIKKLDKKKPVIITGDFNVAHKEIDLANPKTNEGNAGFTKEERRDMDNFLKAGFVDIYRHFNLDRVQYSWWSYRFFARRKNIGWRIDYFLVSNRLVDKIKKAYILDLVNGSDHAPIGIEF